MATILEVAKRAGVSKATVSRVLSGSGYVSPEKRELVDKAIAETGYRPNLLARNLATKSTQTIGLVVTNTLYSGNYFSELMFQSARIMEENGRQLILADGKHTAAEEKAAIQYLLDMRCDGVIIYPRFLSITEMDEIISQHQQPILVINRRLRLNDSYCIFSDQHAASATAVEQLIDRGHRDIAFITGSLDSPTGLERLSGYKSALAAHDIDVTDALIVEGKWNAQSGMAAVDKLLASGHTFSAIVASNDEMAIGAIKRLAECQIPVPSAVSVIGFDDIPLAPYTIPSLSSMKMPVTEMIKETIHRLVSMLDGGELSKRPTFPASLMLRDSVAAGPYLASSLAVKSPQVY
ncbi:DNA-binding transcriptional repressor [Serratia proteamaculans]|uniref:LacI family DNA-binding transcriptional regulator n=1 Tax=Serratia proteamaculans TaxID=28151 RepID=UPI0009F7EC08|nr:LacI family DNA-binding transcriptional regulator [Serratia proteamaculans]SMB51112.1 DNA-binding transcriptional repressor [Serratia proteamaculans]